MSLDEAMRETIQKKRPDAIVVGWAAIVEYIDPKTESKHSICHTFSADGQLISQTLGLSTMLLDYYKSRLIEEGYKP